MSNLVDKRDGIFFAKSVSTQDYCPICGLPVPDRRFCSAECRDEHQRGLSGDDCDDEAVEMRAAVGLD